MRLGESRETCLRTPPRNTAVEGGPAQVCKQRFASPQSLLRQGLGEGTEPRQCRRDGDGARLRGGRGVTAVSQREVTLRAAASRTPYDSIAPALRLHCSEGIRAWRRLPVWRRRPCSREAGSRGRGTCLPGGGGIGGAGVGETSRGDFGEGKGKEEDKEGRGRTQRQGGTRDPKWGKKRKRGRGGGGEWGEGVGKGGAARSHVFAKRPSLPSRPF